MPRSQFIRLSISMFPKWLIDAMNHNQNPRKLLCTNWLALSKLHFKMKRILNSKQIWKRTKLEYWSDKPIIKTLKASMETQYVWNYYKCILVYPSSGFEDWRRGARVREHNTKHHHGRFKLRLELQQDNIIR